MLNCFVDLEILTNLLTLKKALSFLERTSVHHLVLFDLEARHTALVATIPLATHMGNLQHRNTNSQNITGKHTVQTRGPKLE